MAQQDVVTRKRATWLAEESTFGATPASTFPNAPTRIFPSGEKFILGGLTREALQVDDERTRRTAAIAPVLGLQSGSKLDPIEMLLKAVPTANQLDAGSSLASLTPRLVLRHALGSEYAAAGTTCDTGSTTTSIVLQTGDGADFRKGTFVLIEVAGEMEWAKITNIATDTLTVSPALSGAPASGAVVRQMYNYAPGDSHVKSLCVQQAYADSTTAQWTANGCVGDVSFAFPDFGKLAAMALSLQVTSYTGPSDQSLTVAAAADEMSAPFLFKPQVYLAASVARNAPLKCEGVGFETKNDWQPVMDPNAAQAISHYVNVGGRPAQMKGMLKTRFDQAVHAVYEARTPLQFVVVNKTGTGLTASFWIFELPAAVLNENLKPEELRKLLYQGLMFEGTPDTSITDAGETGLAADFIHAVGRIAFG